MILDDDIKQIVADGNIDWDRLQNAKVLVTGATGLIGSLCVRTLASLEQPVEVYALVRDLDKAKALLGGGVRYVTGDVRDPIDLVVSPDYIIHCASVTNSRQMVESPVEVLDVTLGGTNNVLSLAVRCGAKSVVYVSSMEAYGVTTEDQNPVTEEKLGYIDITTARSSYPEGKRAAECLCSAYFHQFGLPVKVARPALTMGAGIPLGDRRVAMQFAKSVVDGRDIVLHTEGKSVSNFCYTSDCVRGIFTVLLKGCDGEAYNVCNDEETRTIREIAELVCDRVAHGAIDVVCDMPAGQDFGYAPDTCLRLSSRKLARLGWKPEVDLETAYHRLVRYIRGE